MNCCMKRWIAAPAALAVVFLLAWTAAGTVSPADAGSAGLAGSGRSIFSSSPPRQASDHEVRPQTVAVRKVSVRLDFNGSPELLNQVALGFSPRYAKRYQPVIALGGGDFIVQDWGAKTLLTVSHPTLGTAEVLMYAPDEDIVILWNGTPKGARVYSRDAYLKKVEALRVDPLGPEGRIRAGAAGTGTTPAQGPGESCSNPIPVAVGTPYFGDTGSAPDQEPPAFYCDTSVGSRGLWHRVVGDGTSFTASLCNSSYDTKIHVFCGDCGNLLCGVGNDDECGLQSEVSFATSPGKEYLVLVDGFGSDAGSYMLAVISNGILIQPPIDPAACAPAPPPPPAPSNDDCANAEPIQVLAGQSGYVTGTNANANGDAPPAPPACDSWRGGPPSHDAPGVFYTFVGTGNTVTFHTCNPPPALSDTTLSVFCGDCTSLACGNPIGHNDDAGASVCGPLGGSALQSYVTVKTAPGARYYVRAGSYSSYLTGPFTLHFVDDGVPVDRQCDADHCSPPHRFYCGDPCLNDVGCCFRYVAGEPRGPFCSDPECCEIVCALDPSCCQDEWDMACVVTAIGNCTTMCGDTDEDAD
jgi:hypothetical protein